MPITIPEVVRHLESIGYKVQHSPDRPDECGMYFATDSYVNSDGEKSLLLVCRVDPEGNYLEIVTPGAYDSRRSKYKAAFFAAMLHLAFLSRHVQMEHDPSDGEIRFSVDVPVLDGTLTQNQVHALVVCLLRVCEEFHPVLVHAMETGRIEFERRWAPKPHPDSGAAPAPPSLPPELADLIGRMGGIEKLEALLAQHRTEGAAR